MQRLFDAALLQDGQATLGFKYPVFRVTAAAAAEFIAELRAETFVPPREIPAAPHFATGRCVVKLFVGPVRYQLAAEQLRRDVGLTAMQSWAYDRVPGAPKDAEGFLARTDVDERNRKWLACNRKYWNKLMSDPYGEFSVLITEEFAPAVRLCHWKDVRRPPAAAALNILKVLVYRKFVGTSDTNAFNLMIDERCRVLSVDENVPSPEKWARMLTTGDSLFSAQPRAGLSKETIDALKRAVKDFSGELAAFCDALFASEDIPWSDEPGWRAGDSGAPHAFCRAWLARARDALLAEDADSGRFARECLSEPTRSGKRKARD